MTVFLQTLSEQLTQKASDAFKYCELRDLMSARLCGWLEESLGRKQTAYQLATH